MNLRVRAASICLGLTAATAMSAPPLPLPLTRTTITNQLAWDGYDGQLSMELPWASSRVLTDVVTVDDFYVASSPAGTWQVREVKVLMIANASAPASRFRLRVFRDAAGGRLGSLTNPRPGTTAYTRLGASRVTDRGPAVDGYRLYEVAFDLTATACSLPSRNWYWIGVDHVGSPGTGQYYLATHRQAGLNGAAGRYNNNFPTGSWGFPLFAPSDFAMYVRATTPAIVLGP